MWHAAQIAEAIHQYGPDYGFETTVNRFDWDTLISSRSAYIDRIHQSYDRVLGNNKVDVIKVLLVLLMLIPSKSMVKKSRLIIF